MNLADYHEQLITTVAHGLGSLNREAVYVGGAVVSFYANDPAARDVRPTKDVDITLEITSSGKLEELRQKLVSRGFRQSAQDNVTCRFHFQDIKVDVMGTQNIGWAPANRWFEPGFKYLRTIQLSEIAIHVLSLPYFLASKFEAFRGRAKDPRTSHDLEDVTYVLDNRIDLAEEVSVAPENVLDYLSIEFKNILNDDLLQEAILAHLEPPIQTERFEMIAENLKEIVENR